MNCTFRNNIVSGTGSTLHIEIGQGLLDSISMTGTNWKRGIDPNSIKM